MVKWGWSGRGVDIHGEGRKYGVRWAGEQLLGEDGATDVMVRKAGMVEVKWAPGGRSPLDVIYAAHAPFGTT